jgi:hypothetical protein
MGGMFGESKYDVIKKIPQHVIPKTVLINTPTTSAEVMKRMADEGFSFPVIFKPDIGERGYLVKKIALEDDVERYLGYNLNFLIQELIDLPLEFGVFYTKFPNENKGSVTSITGKEMLTVTGNGNSTLKELILNKERAKLQWRKLKDHYRDQLDEIIEEGRKIELVSIGNHALGTMFLDRTDLITDKLCSSFNEISMRIDGFYFGRYDLRCKSVQDLENGNVKILELNGCGAEPSHIYQPGFSFWKAIKVLFNHWRNIYVISNQNRKNGHRFITMKDGYYYYKQFKAATRG